MTDPMKLNIMTRVEGEPAGYDYMERYPMPAQKPTARIAFVDTETTGLSLDDDIWEFAAIVREPNGDEWQYHMFIEHDTQRCNLLPESFLTDHRARFPQFGTPGWHPDVKSRKTAAKEIETIFTGGPHIVGAVPNFDTERIAILLRRFGLEPGWHYCLIDVRNLAVGYLAGMTARHNQPHDVYPKEHNPLIVPPWDPEELSRAVGVDPGQFEKHTALGDALWCRALYDAVVGE